MDNGNRRRESFAAIQNNTVNSISVGEIGGESGEFAEIAQKPAL